MFDTAEGGDELTHTKGSSGFWDDNSAGKDSQENMESTGKLPHLDPSSVPEVTPISEQGQSAEPHNEPKAAEYPSFSASDGDFSAFESSETLESVSSEEFMSWGFDKSSMWDAPDEEAFLDDELAEDGYDSSYEDTDADLFGGYVTDSAREPMVDAPPYDEMEADVQERPRRLDFHNPRTRAGIIIAVVVLLLAAAYGVGVYYFSSRFLPNTSINGYKVAGATLAEAQASLEQETMSYACDVSVSDFYTRVPGNAIALDRDEQTLVQEAYKQQNAFAWPIALFAPLSRVVELPTTYDSEALAAIVDQAVDAYHEETLSPIDADILYNYDTEAYELVGSVTGKVIDKDTLKGAVNNSVTAFSTVCTPVESEVMRAATVEDLPSYARVVEWINRDQSSDIDIIVNGETVMTADSDLISEWTSVGKGPSVAVDEEAVAAWAEYSLADSVFYRDDWDNHYLDVEAFVSELVSRLSIGVVDDMEAPLYEKRRLEGLSRDQAYEYSGWDSSRGRYIDVDLTAQFARLYSETGEVLWESAVVSGDTYQAHSTVTGDFEIYAKQTNATLVGLDYNNDGNPDYESFVNYWMPFYGGYGLHDATWRYSFGGDQYAYDGSHGCVNLPYEKAKELYGLTFVGEKVHIYWEDTVEDSED